VGSDRNRMLLALGALEIAAICGPMGFLIEYVFGIDLPIINWIV
jgi:hypothetical protein